MATIKHYTAKKKRYTIHRPATVRAVMFQGNVVAEKVYPEPIEFIDGRFSTSDPTIITILEEWPGFGRDYVALKDVDAQLATAGLEAVHEEEPVKPAAPIVIEGVKNRNQAVSALIERNVDPDAFDSSSTKDKIKEIAAANGFTFKNW